ncbi:unnamed protein product [Thlaspi arvense]|uniref:Uncharacterized protein n=1 Tax=Thlaspi arvense TaxID=13288 RepID=A0AAU9RJ48_THLAR|nr:unnamed protein product [Thlaspi arvense]
MRKKNHSRRHDEEDASTNVDSSARDLQLDSSLAGVSFHQSTLQLQVSVVCLNLLNISIAYQRFTASSTAELTARLITVIGILGSVSFVLAISCVTPPNHFAVLRNISFGFVPLTIVALIISPFL